MFVYKNTNTHTLKKSFMMHVLLHLSLQVNQRKEEEHASLVTNNIVKKIDDEKENTIIEHKMMEHTRRK